PHPHGLVHVRRVRPSRHEGGSGPPRPRPAAVHRCPRKGPLRCRADSILVPGGLRRLVRPRGRPPRRKDMRARECTCKRLSIVSGLVVELTTRIVVARITRWWRFAAIVGTPSTPCSFT